MIMYIIYYFIVPLKINFLKETTVLVFTKRVEITYHEQGKFTYY